MKKFAKGFAAFGLAAALCAGMAIPAFGADATNPLDKAGDATNKVSGVGIDITAEVSTVSINVPTKLPISFAADGSVTLPTNFEIKNNSDSTITLKKIGLAGTGDWKLAAAETETFAADDKKLLFKIGQSGNMTIIGADTALGAPINIVNGTPQKLVFDVPKHSAFKTAVDATTGANAYAMTMTFDWA